MPNLYETLITGSAPKGGSADASALASQLRGKESRATLAQLSGDSVLAPYGAQEAKGVKQQANQVRQSALVRAREAAEMERHNAMMAHRDRALTQAAEQGSLNRGNRLQAAAMRALNKPSKPIPTKLQEKLFDTAKSYSAIRGLRGRMSDASPGQRLIPGVSTAETWLANQWGTGTDAAKKKAEWWNNWNRMYALVARHELFGSALTPTEKSSFQSATINPEMDLAQLESITNSMEKVLKAELDKQKGVLSSSGRYDQGEIDILGRVEDFEESETEPEPEITGSVFDASTGKWE